MNRDPCNHSLALPDPSNPHHNGQPATTENISLYEEVPAYPHSRYSRPDTDYYSEPVRQQKRVPGPRPDPYSLRLHSGQPEKAARVPKRNFGTILVSIVLYLWAMACGLLGTTGILLGTTPLGATPLDTAPRMWQVALGLTLILWIILNILLLIMILIFHKRPRFRWWLRPLCTIATTIAAVAAIYIASHFVDFSNGIASSQENLTMGTIFLIYALITGFIALF